MTVMKILVKLTRRAGNAWIASLSRSVFLCDYDMPFRAAFCLSQNESLRETIHIKKNYVKISPADSFSRTRTNSFSYERFYMSSHFETEAQGKSEMALGSYRLLCCKSRTVVHIYSEIYRSKTELAAIYANGVAFNFKWKYERLAIDVHLLELKYAE